MGHSRFRLDNAMSTNCFEMRIMRDVKIQEEVRREVLSLLEINWLAGHQRSREALPSLRQRALTATADVPSSVTKTTDTTSTLQPPPPPLQKPTVHRDI
ncbi:hypothetical protein Tco_0282087 [Tanacetum coccineum]